MKFLDLHQNSRRRLVKKRRLGKRAVIFLSVVALAILAVIFLPHLSISDWLKPMAVFSQIMNPSSLAEDEGWTNVLLLGLDRRAESTTSGTLTDTMIIASLAPEKQRALLISLPRDLWVRVSGNYYTKVNSAYAYGGVAAARDTVSGILGVPIHYYGLVDFAGFEKAVDTLGGLEVNVERAFDDYRFPIPGMEMATCGLEEPETIEDPVEREKQQYRYWCRFERVHFDTGWQLMDGEMALKYARSRHASGAEGNDFARARRQQNVLLAAKDRLLNLDVLTDFSKLKNLYQAAKGAIRTDLGLGELEKLYRIYGKFGSDWEVETVVIDGSSGEAGFLYTPQDSSPYRGQYVLIPKAGDFSEVQAYIQKLMFSE